MKKGIQLVTDIMGTRIKTSRGEDIGVVQNVMVDPQSGEIVYIVLCYADFFGKTNRHFAIPRTCLGVTESDASLHLEIDEEKLLVASGYVSSSSYDSKECVHELSRDTTTFLPKYMN